ncbi:hypothetical protein Pcinc_005748 [Petrolisthes cinctipes]|uniref:Uncharacterized protein n=1 Tax=Petrolisthes cinctipes TaxID=88211 RepID=A0AAE1KZR0_PETCI|nr:hypothetical protein Pcinc_005748 [Petrolisthes cinctipes]
MQKIACTMDGPAAERPFPASNAEATQCLVGHLQVEQQSQGSPCEPAPEASSCNVCHRLFGSQNEAGLCLARHYAEQKNQQLDKGSTSKNGSSHGGARDSSL